MTREDMISALIDSDHTFRHSDDFPGWFETILREGFKGYQHMTDDELSREIKERRAGGEIIAGE